MTSVGYGSGVEFKEILRVYPNRTYRRYLKNNAAHETRKLVFESLSQSKYDSIISFFIARKQQTGSDQEFYLYDPDEVSAIDPTGVSTTGRHTAIFLDSVIEFTRSGRCSYSGEINILLLN